MAEIGVLQVGSLQIGTTEIGTAQARPREIHLPPAHAGHLQVVEVGAAEIEAIHPDTGLTELFQRLVAGVAEPHSGLLAIEHQLHRLHILALAPLTPLQNEQEAGGHDAQRLQVVHAHHTAGVAPEATLDEMAVAALIPAVHHGQRCQRGTESHEQAQPEGVLQPSPPC